MRYILFFSLWVVATLSLADERLEAAWSTDAVFKSPESVVYDSRRDVYYVSNINGEPAAADGNGFISKLSPEGEVVDLQWITGLNAPKGLAVVGDRLFAADINDLVEMDIPSGKISARHHIEGAKFLNDVAATSDDTVYVSDTAVGDIHRFNVRTGELRTWVSLPELDGVNGLYPSYNGLLAGSMKSGKIFLIDWVTKNSRIYSEGYRDQDGITGDGHGMYFVSAWSGAVFHLGDDQEAQLLMDTSSDKINAADIMFDTRHGLLLVPTFMDNRVMAYTTAE